MKVGHYVRIIKSTSNHACSSRFWPTITPSWTSTRPATPTWKSTLDYRRSRVNVIHFICVPFTNPSWGSWESSSRVRPLVSGNRRVEKIPVNMKNANSSKLWRIASMEIICGKTLKERTCASQTRWFRRYPSNEQSRPVQQWRQAFRSRQRYHGLWNDIGSGIPLPEWRKLWYSDRSSGRSWPSNIETRTPFC